MHYLHGNVSLQETWDEALRLAREKFGRVDVVVNNAGKVSITGTLSFEEADFQKLQGITYEPSVCPEK